MNNTNYDKIFQTTIESFGQTRPRLLLHTCCAPCLTSCLLRLLNHFNVTVFYSNDNITEFDEHKKRLEEIRRLVEIVNNGQYEIHSDIPLKLEIAEHNPTRFFDTVAGFETEKEGGARCRLCYKMRLQATAEFAQKNGFDYFSTTLTLSPHKNSAILNEIGLELQNSVDVKFLHSDFKKQNGFLLSTQLSEKYQLYRQAFCGCPYSKLT